MWMHDALRDPEGNENHDASSIGNSPGEPPVDGGLAPEPADDRIKGMAYMLKLAGDGFPPR